MPLRNAITTGATDGTEPDRDAARARAIELVELTLTAAMDRQEASATEQAQPIGQWSSAAITDWRELAGLIDTVAMEFFFASGAHRDQATPEDEHVPSPAQERLYREGSAILDGLTSIGHPQAAHRLLETLEFFVDLDPRGAFLRVVATIRSGQQFNYEYDNMAEALFVRLIERYLAEHRTLLQQDPECAGALIEILDVFVSAGWLSAHRLTYGLDEIYR